MVVHADDASAPMPLDAGALMQSLSHYAGALTNDGAFMHADAGAMVHAGASAHAGVLMHV